MRLLAAALGVSRSDDGVSVPEGITPPPRAAATRDAFNLDSVYRAVFVLQTAATQLSIDARRNGEALTGDAYPQIISRPSPETVTDDLIADSVASLAVRGNAYWLIGRSPDNRAAAIRVLNPLDCLPVFNPRTGARTVQWNGREYGPDQIRHLRLLRIPGRAEGLGPIQACRNIIDGAQDMSDYAAQWTRNGGVPTGILSTDQSITQAQADEMKDRWKKSVSIDGGVAVMGSNMRYQHLPLKPSEVQFLESRAFDVLAVGRMFGIPAHMLLAAVNGSSMTYQNINDASVDFIRWTLMGYLRPIETALTQILPARTKARFNLDALMRADTKTRMESHSIAIQAGIYDAAYAARIEGLPTPEKDTKE